MIRDLLRSPLILAIVAWHVVWGLIALATDAALLIEVLNGLVLAIACGVVAAYAKPVLVACQVRRPTSGDILIVGIWLSWVSLIEGRIWSIVTRSLGLPRALLINDFVTHIIALALLAGLFHLAGPEAIEGRVPSRQWIKIGCIAAGGVGITILVALLFRETGGLLRTGR